MVWEIELDAESAEQAAELARDIQMDPDNLATHFTVDGEEIELDSEMGSYNPNN